MESTADYRILIMEDEESTRQALAEALSCAPNDQVSATCAAGSIELVHVQSREQALEKIRESFSLEQLFAIMFVGHATLRRVGPEALQEILDADPDIHVVVCTDSPEPSRVEILSRYGPIGRISILSLPVQAWEASQSVGVTVGHWRRHRHSRLTIAQLKAFLDQQSQTLHDERREYEEALRSSQDRYALAVSGSNDGIWDWNVATGSVFFSTRWKAMLGFSEDEIAPKLEEWFNRVHPEDLEKVRAAFDAHIHGKNDHFRAEYRMRHKDGHYRWVLSRGLAVRDETGKVSRAAGSQTEITDRKLAEEQLRHDALHDALTGLANRSLLLERIGNCMQRAVRVPDYLFATLFLDVDRFKVINDSLGHDAGDQLLVEIARRMTTVVRSIDTLARMDIDHLARLGGDEFVVLLDSIRDHADGVRVAQRLLESLAEPFKIGRHDVITSASIGIAFGNGGYARPEEILRDADAALYHAKADCKSRYRIYKTEMHTRAMKRLQLESDLRRALDRDELYLQYQPIHSLASGEVVELEALVRWKHPERGPIPPSEFIPLSEETGLIVQIGSWVLRTACRQLKRWQEESEGLKMGIGVNVSAGQFARTELASEVRGVLKETQLDPHCLSLEITESTIMETGAGAMEALAALRDLGIRLHLDDFGTGYSSLGYLNQMPVHVLKVDRSFINQIHTGKAGGAIVQAIVTLAHSLDMEVIAEGVETEPQSAILKSMGCDMAQGFFLSRPIDARDVMAYAKRQIALPAVAASA